LFLLLLPFLATAQTPDTLRSAQARAEGDSLLGAKQFEASTRAYERGILPYMEAGDTLNLNLSALYHQIGNNLIYLERNRAAIEMHQKSLAIRQKRQGSESIKVAETYQSFSVVYQNMRLLDTAIQYSRLCLEIYQKTFGLYSEHLPPQIVNLGNCYLMNEQTDSAKVYYLRALSVYDSLKITHRSGSVWNNLGQIAARVPDVPEAIRCYKKAAALIAVNSGENSTEMLMPWLNLSSCMMDLGEHDSSIHYLQKCLSVSIPAYGENHPEVAREWANLGISYGGKGDQKRALEWLFKAEKVLVQNHGKEHPDLSIIYTSIANNLAGYPRQSLDYHLKALYLAKKHHGETSDQVVFSYNNIAENCAANDDYAQAIRYSRQAIALFARQRKSDDNHPVFGVLYCNAGNYYSGNHQWDTALIYYNKAIAVRQKFPQPWSVDEVYINLGITYGRMRRPEEGLRWYARYDSCARAQGKPVLPEMYQGMGSCHQMLRDYDAAFRCYDKAAAAAGYESDMASVKNRRSFFDTMSGKGEALRTRYERDKNLSDLYAASRLYSQMFAAERATHDFFPKKGGDGQVLESGTAAVENALATAVALQKATGEARWADTAFAFVEQSRAMVLYAAMKSAEARQFGNVDSALLAQEYDLRVEIAWREKQQHEAEERADQPAADRAAALAADARRGYNDLKKRLEISYPDYYRLQYDRSLMSAEELRRQMLDDSTSLLEYFVGDSAVYIFVLNRDGLTVHAEPKNFPLEKWVQQMRHGLADYHVTKSSSQTKYIKDAQSYTEASFQIYQKTVAPVARLLRRNVVLVPDRMMGLVPFDALLTARPEKATRFGTHTYLGQKHRLSLSFSANLLHEMRAKKHKTPARETLLAMAPFFRGDTLLPFSALDTLFSTKRNVLSSLPHSGPEAVDAARQFSGRVLLGTAATKGLFQQLAALYRIIHLSTHGKANEAEGDYAYLAFSLPHDTLLFDKFYVREIYNLILSADLVTLSACETGIGEQQGSEGIISLARAFAYAGAKSILTTLWPVDDLNTRRLMQFFYQNLGQGMKKDEALWKAKQQFVAAYPAYAHPYFWSGFFLIGDTEGLH